MADEATAKPEPPLVTRVEPTIARKPRPGFAEAVIWCIVFLCTQTLAALVAVCVVLTIFALHAPDVGKFYNDQLAGLGNAAAGSPGERPEVPAEIARSLACGMLAAQFASLGLVLLLVPRRIGPDWKRQVGLRRPAALHLLLVLLLVPGFMILSDGVQELIRRVTGMQPPTASETLRGTFRTFPWFLTLLAVSLGPGVVEELWCRGFLGRGLCARHGLLRGVLLTSLLFGLMHLDPSFVVIAALMGAYLHFVYLASRSIWVPIVLHTLNNGLATLLELQPALRAGAERFKDDPLGLRGVIDVASLALLLFASIALWTSRAELVPQKKRKDSPVLSGWTPEYPGISSPPPGTATRIGYAIPSPVAMLLTLASFGVLVYLLLR